ncbi:hypothetical protein EC991_001840 [Linnemannia zychae]|nr:hypothetical protein EC991_001840 [Linnemannia zychae]
MEQTSATLSRAGASNMTQDAAVIPTTPLPITVPTPTTQPSGNTTSTALLSGSNATAKTPAPSFMSFAPLPTKPIVTRTLTPPTPTNPPTTSLSIPPALQGASLQKVTPPWTIISSVLQDTPSLSTSSQPALLLTSAVHTTPTQTYSPQATPDPPTISPLRPQPVFLAQATKTSDVRYPNPVSSVSPQYTSLPKTGASSNIATATSAVASKVQLAPKKASSVRVAHLKRQERSHSPELGEIVSDKEDTEKEDFNTTSTGKVTSQVQRDVAEGRKPGVQQNIQQKLQLATTERALQDKGNADEIIGALTGSVSLQDTPDALVVSRPVLALEPQDYHPSQPSKQSPQQQQQQSPQQQYQEPKPIAVVNTARAEVNPTILLHDIKIWMEIETKKRKDDSALLERLVIKNTVLEAKLDEHISKMEQETKRQESHRAITHSRNQDISSLKEQSLAQDLKMSQMENQVEARMRQMLQQDLQVVRNALQEERVDNLAKDLEVKRAEAMETMAKARAEMLDARQMVAEAREERANAMERAAKAEADNQMLLRVINELQGTGWRLSEQGQGQSHSDGQFLDAGVQGYGRLPSIPSAATVLYPELQFDHRLRQLAPGSPLSRFMRFGTEMQQSFSSSSTESLVEPTATAATAHDPKFKRMEMASVKLENELISHPHVDPDMTEDDEGRTDTDGDATEEE